METLSFAFIKMGPEPEFFFIKEDENGNYIEFPKEIDLKKLLKKLPDTTNTMFGEGRYKEYSKEELIELSK